jgi:ATP-dependent Clp protease protease subunit
MSKLYLYGTIGYDIDADYVRLALDDTTGDLELRINSGGGDVFEGNSIYALLNSWKARPGNFLRIYVDGLAASIASVIAMSGNEVVMSNNSLMMIHNPWTPAAAGDANDLRETANVLDKVRDTIMTVYADRTGLDLDTIGNLMDEETWLSADEAINFGFADRIVSASEEAMASIKAFNYINAPEYLTKAVEPVLEDEPADVVGMTLAEAKLKLSRCCNK